MLRFDPSELRKYAGLTLLARNVVEGFLTGVHRSPFKGFSVEFAEHRQYTPGDEIRHIDWRAYGKTDRYYIKEFEEETNLKSYLLVDASGSMAYKGKGKQPSKFQYAQYVAASLAFLMLHQLDAVGLITHDTKVRSLIPPKANPKHLLNVLRTLEQTKPGGETGMAAIWNELASHHLKRRGMVIILSDFFDDIDALTRALRHLRHRNHEVILFHILDPDETDFPFGRLTQFRNLEKTDERLMVDARRLREEYLANFGRFCEQLRERAGNMHMDYHLLRTDRPVDRALGIYLSRRQRQPMPFTFLHTAILFGLIALIIPPIVHLLNRRRFEVVDWAAMQFLHITKKIRRRMVFEQVLLMLLRCALIAALVLAIASPVINLSCVGRMPFGQRLAKLAGQNNRDIVIIVDGSYSMEYGTYYQLDERTGAEVAHKDKTADADARKWARQFLDDLLPGDRVAVLQAKQRTIPVVETLTADLNEVKSRIDGMPQPRGGVRWDFAIPKALDILQLGPNPQKEIIILTDGQRQGWADADALGNWQNIAQSYAVVNPPRITVVNVVPDRPSNAPNWFVGPIRTNRAVATIGREVRFKFDLQIDVSENRSDTVEGQAIPAPPSKVSFEVDGKQIGSKTPVKSGAPRIGMDFVQKFSTPGTHLVSAIIDKDALPGDNRRDFAVEVLPSIPVLLVDGEPRGGVRKRSSDFLRRALAPDNDPQPSFILRTVAINEFGSQLLTSPLTRDPGTLPRVVILCNVPGLSSEQSKAVDDFMLRGGGVFVTLGERCDPRSFNALFPHEGKGWLPARLIQPTGEVNDLANAATPHEADLKHHPALELFKDCPKDGLSYAVFPRFWLLDAADRDAGAVILKMKNRQESPLLVERNKVGAGRVILSAAPFDDSWRTNLPRVEDFVPLCHEIMYYLAAARSGSINLEPNAHMIFRPADGEPPCGISIDTPDGVPLRREVASWPLDFDGTRETGVYKLKTDSGKVTYYVVQPDGSESMLAPCDDKDRKAVRAFFPEGRFEYENDRARIKELFEKNVNPPQVWWLFLLLVLGLLLTELAFTRNLARKSPPVTD